MTEPRDTSSPIAESGETSGRRVPSPSAGDSAEPIDFDVASAVRPRADGGFAATLHPQWNGPLTPHGGLMIACVLRAVDATVNEDQSLQARTLSCHFLRPPENGDVEISVTPVRTGRRFVNTSAELSQGGRPCVVVQLTHAKRGLVQAGRWQPRPPATSEPPTRAADTLPDHRYFADPDGHWLAMNELMPRFFRQMKVAPRFGHIPFSAPTVDPRGDGTENGGWLMPSFSRAVDPLWLAVCCDAFWPSAMQALDTPLMSPTLDLTIHLRAELPPEGLPDQPLLAHNRTVALLDGLGDTETRVFSADGDLLAQARQLQFVAPLTER